MIFDLLWNRNPPLTKVFCVLTVFLAALVHIEPNAESKMYLIRGKEHELWRYITTVFYQGKFSLKFILRGAIS